MLDHASIARRGLLAAAFAGLLFALLPTGSASAGPQLAPNPSFELSPSEGSVLGSSPAHGVSPQPLLPTGWVFEGAAGFFDHAHPQHDLKLGLDARRAHHVDRFVQISIPLSGPETQCQDVQECEDAIDGAKAGGQGVYSVDPVWRTAAPILVNPGQTYTLSVYTKLDFVTAGTGSFAGVRWLNASAQPIRVDTVERIQSPFDPVTTPWQRIARTVKAPAGAVKADLLLGSTGDLWIGGLQFDLVSFS